MRTGLPSIYRVRSLPAKAVLLCLPALVLPAAAAQAASTDAPSAESQSGGFAYDPLPNQATPANPGAARGTSGGATYSPGLRPRRKRSRARRQRPARPLISELSSGLHRFPVLGEHSYGGPDARFGAPRPGHRHQGQDVVAAEGTPIVAPRGGTITWRAFQAAGAGYYLVLDPVVEAYNYVFMHLQRGSIQVKVGDRVRTGEVIASVGSTGVASGPHLHFEIWDGPWFNGGHPIDPLPALLAWDTFS